MKHCKHSVGWYTVKQLTRRIKIQRGVIIALSIMLTILVAWLHILGGR